MRIYYLPSVLCVPISPFLRRLNFLFKTRELTLLTCYFIRETFHKNN